MIMTLPTNDGKNAMQSVLNHTAKIVAAHVSNPINHLKPSEVVAFYEELFNLIKKCALGMGTDDSGLGKPIQKISSSSTTSVTTSNASAAAVSASKPIPAVPIEKSVTDDYIVCLENGVHRVMLKRYLKTQFGMTPEEYREKWGLPANYPMASKNHLEFRAKKAKEIGLGYSGPKKANLRPK